MDNQVEHQEPQAKQDKLQSNDEPDHEIGQQLGHNTCVEQDRQQHTSLYLSI